MKEFLVKLALVFSCVIYSVASMTDAQAINFDTNFAELDTSKMITTGDTNYAICNHHFPSNWRSVSVNGDEVTIGTRDSQVTIKKYSALTPDEKKSLETIRNNLMALVRSGPFNVKSETGFAKLTTFDRNGGSSSMGTGSSNSAGSSSSSSSSSGGVSIQKTGKDAYIVVKPDFPFNWLRVFMIEDVDTIIYRNGRVIMLQRDLFRMEERNKLIALRQEVENSAKTTEKMTSGLQNSLKNPMDFVNKALGGIFG